MLLLRLRSPGATYTADPSPSIELRGGEIFLEGHAEPTARYESGAWLHSGCRCTYLECRAILSICFVDVDGNIRSSVGPRAVVCVRDRYVFAGRERVAKLTLNRGVWVRPNKPEAWPVLRLVPGGPRISDQ
jgi:hypothetical protein